jgi:hypothetical protein
MEVFVTALVALVLLVLGDFFLHSFIMFLNMFSASSIQQFIIVKITASFIMLY